MATAAKAAPAKAAKATEEPDDDGFMDVPGHWRQLDDTGHKVAWVAGDSTEVCDDPEHMVHPIHPTATGWSCEHRTVKFRKPARPDGASVVQTESVGDKKRRLAELAAEIEADEAREAAGE